MNEAERVFPYTNQNEEIIFEDSIITKRHISIKEYRINCRKALLQEIISEFENCVSENWKQQEIIDFLNDLLKNENE